MSAIDLGTLGSSPTNRLTPFGTCCPTSANIESVPTATSVSPSADRRPRLHTRAYEIESILEDNKHFRLVGHLRDVNPAGLWGVGPNEPITMHHMQVELLVAAPSLVIVDVSVTMHVHPQTQCTNILPAYDQLVGLSIARGFTHKVREMFGGPRACTHIGALLNAMAPVAIQSLWGFFEHTQGGTVDSEVPQTPDFERNRNTCHVWAEHGPMFALLADGAQVPIPLWASKRLEQTGITEDIWRQANR